MTNIGLPCNKQTNKQKNKTLTYRAIINIPENFKHLNLALGFPFVFIDVTERIRSQHNINRQIERNKNRENRKNNDDMSYVMMFLSESTACPRAVWSGFFLSVCFKRS